MARKLRIEFKNARYHVINRGNYRRDVFETPGAISSFLATLNETVQQYGWGVFAFVVMRNHYHLVVETPSPNLVDGMHWLQSTFATRFNRFRKESGHLFQGRYKSIVIEDDTALGRVVDYVHLNPVRAGRLPATDIGRFKSSSLCWLLDRKTMQGLQPAVWLEAIGGWSDGLRGVRAYEKYLIALGEDEERQMQLGLEKLSSGWAIGSTAWKESLARKYSQMVLIPGIDRETAKELRKAIWEEALERILGERRLDRTDLAKGKKRQDWKIDLAIELRRGSGASIPWISEVLSLGKPSSVRSYLSRAKS